MIKPTVGRVVWFRPSESTIDVYGLGKDARLAAIITRVWNDARVALCVFNPDGIPMARTAVTLVQEGVAPFEEECEWMPYQKGQAAKTEALEKQVAA